MLTVIFYVDLILISPNIYLKQICENVFKIMHTMHCFGIFWFKKKEIEMLYQIEMLLTQKWYFIQILIPR